MDNFYITTPIYYVNGKPHIGHAYTTIVADTLARWRAGRGADIRFLTGTDENSQKTVDAAKKSGEEIHAYTDRLADEWAAAWKKLGVGNTDFMRTTEDRHVTVVREFWKRMEMAGDLYKGQYEGLYCKGHEAFLRPDELTPDGLCPDHKVAPERVMEENYFFKLSKYEKPLLDFYSTHEDFVAPTHRFNEVKSFVEAGLEDVSFSRERRGGRNGWGIEVPDDPSQAIYVWADALVNYISAVGVEGWEEHPADIHAVGKDILRFHAVIWPAMLMSAGLPLPGQIIANGFLTIGGVKMGKSLGNAVNPLDLAERYGNDALRYFLLREIPYGSDGDFSEEKLKERYASDLAKGLGNFTARVLALAEKEDWSGLQGGSASRSISQSDNCRTSDPQNISGTSDKKISDSIEAMKREVEIRLGDFKFQDALAAVWSVISVGDKYMNDEKVWEIADADRRRGALLNLLYILENVAAALAPFLPDASRKISSALAREGGAFNPKKIPPLFPKLDEEPVHIKAGPDSRK